MEDLNKLGRMIDISAVKTAVTVDEIKEMVEFAKEKNLICVFGMPCYIPMIKELLKDSKDIRVGGVVGFPSGADPTEMKIQQTKWNIQNGADEIDMVINVGFLKSGMYDEVLHEIKEVVKAANGKPVKVILEVAYLNDQEIVKGTELVIEGGATFVKTGTGWAPNPTTIHHIELISSVVQGRIGIKAAGGVKSYDVFKEMMEKGVTRFGLGRDSIKKIYSEIEKQ